MDKVYFACDYMEGAHPAILARLAETNLVRMNGYGYDDYTISAREKIKQACQCPDGEVYFLVGGTQTNATVIDALLAGYQGVVAADTGHVSVHEAGAIEASGHKVLTIPSHLGKIDPWELAAYLRDFYDDGNHDHMVMPGMVYISNPTEYGTLYSHKEMEEIHNICQEYKIPLYVDGARMAYALACPENDMSLADFAQLSDIFYIGGTKCGALLGEAVVIPKKGLIPHFFTLIKQHGALLAKGRLLGIQFDELFREGLYERIGSTAVKYAQRLQEELKGMGYPLLFESPTNQIFCILDNEKYEEITKYVENIFWEKYDDEHTAVRFATSWATTEEDLEQLLEILRKFA